MLAHSQLENRLRTNRLPKMPLMLCFSGQSRITIDEFGHTPSPSYPEGNLGGNQLLEDSIGLSPLCPAKTTRFARQDCDRPPPQLPTASP